jgi:hypothetical protein
LCDNPDQCFSERRDRREASLRPDLAVGGCMTCPQVGVHIHRRRRNPKCSALKLAHRVAQLILLVDPAADNDQSGYLLMPLTR